MARLPHRRCFAPMRFRRCVLFGLLVWGIPATAAPSPEEGRLLSQVFLPEDYHGDTEVSDVVQTPDGLIYAGNLGALKEFDGRTWSTIPLPTGWIRQLAVGAEGSVYFAGFDEIGPIERGADGRRRFRSLLAQVPRELQPLGRIRGCVAHGRAIFWSTARHVLRWDGQRMKTWTYPEASSLTLRAGGRHLYLGNAGDALYRLEGDDWQLITRAPAVTRELAVIVDEWAGTGPLAIDAAGAFWRWRPDGTVESYPTTLTAEDLAGGVVDGRVLHDGRLALCAEKGGLLVLTPDGRVDLRFGGDGGVGLPIFHRIFQDRVGGLWIGSGLGVVRVDLDRSVTMFDEKAGIPPGVGLSVFLHDGTLHSCGEDGLYRFQPGENGRRGRFVRVDGPVFYPYGTEPHASGRLVLSDKGLFRFEQGRFHPQFTTSEQAYVIHVSANEPDRLFLGGTGFLRTARWDGQTWRDDGAIESMHEDAISLAEDREGSLWIGTPTNGAVRVHRRPGHEDWQSALTTRYGPERGLPGGHEWVSTYPGPLRPLMSHSRGVSIYDSIADRIVPDPAFTAAGRNDRYVFPLTCTAAGTVWAQVGNPARDEPIELGGVAADGRGGARWVSLPGRLVKAMGFPGAYQMSWQPQAPGDAGVLWVVTRGKVFRVDLAAAGGRSQAAPPGVVLRAVERADVSYPVDAPATAAIALPRTKEPLRLRLACPVFDAGSPVTFQHRLAGFGDWSTWATNNEVVFTNLPVGRFTFEARARVGDDPASPVLAWHCVVRPPWWQSRWAQGAYVLAGVAGLWSLLRWRTSALERERQRLERLVQARTDELEQQRDRADAANRAKTTFLANMSHELRTPLHAILGYAQMLGADVTLPETARERLRIVGSSGRHLLRLINEVLDLTKIEAGRLELRPAPFDLPALLASVAAAHEPRAAAKGLVFHRGDVAGLPNHALGDAAKLRQVLENLLGNAIKFTGRGEVRLLAVTVAPGRVRFEVSDTGPGIAASDLTRLFQPFTQLAPAGVLAVEGGTGLGLAIAQRLVALMGGKLEVASTVGQGSRFWFEVPLAAAFGEDSSVRRPLRIVGYEGPRRRVLAVDDIEPNRRLFVDLLAPLGFEVIEAASAAAALERLEAVRPDLVLLDLRLPDLDGLSLARKLRADPRLEGVKILAASASVFNQNPAEAVAAGCDGFIAKPFLPEQFLARIAALLGLVWREVDDNPAATARSLDPGLLAALHAAAEAGDVVAIREAFAGLRERHAGAAALEPLAQAMAAFDTPTLMRLTAAAATGAKELKP